MRNCWLLRTPLETALLLILIVAVPFLLIMIIIYTTLLVQNCPDCSTRCGVVCSRQSSNSGVIPMLLQLNPNISLPKLAAKYEICPDSMLGHFKLHVDHASVVSIVKDVYTDDLTNQRYLCAAAVITFKWVVSSGKCVENINRSYTDVFGVFVRAGSNYWTGGGSVHEIKKILFADATISTTVAAIELKTEFPRLPSIRPIMLSRKSLYKHFGVAQLYGWKSNDSIPLKFRKKNVKMQSEPVIIFKDAHCLNKSTNQSYVFCSVKVRPTIEPCMFYTGFPVIRARILLGVDIGQFCDSKRNTTVYLIYDITKALNWLEKTTNVYVEHF